MLLSEPDFLTNKEITACFAGHRPSKLPFPEDETEKIRLIQKLIRREIEDALDLSYTTFITGMAKGVDTWAAMEVLQLKNKYSAIKLVGVSPFRAEIEHLKGADLWRYDLIRHGCDQMVFLADSYFPNCYLVRNKFMVDHSSLVIGAVSDMQSGTGNTIRYAKKMGLNMRIIDINSLSDSCNPDYIII